MNYSFISNYKGKDFVQKNPSNLYNEKAYIKKIDPSPFKKFKRGELVISENKYDTYEIVLYLGDKPNTPGTCECLCKTLNRDDNAKPEKKDFSKDLLYHYYEYEQIRPDILPGQPAQSLDYLIETYIQ